VPSHLIGIARLAANAPSLQAKRTTEYFQLPAYELLTRCTSTRVPFEWSINPYRGCEFACKYCYARYTHEFMELRDPTDFEHKIFAKQFNPIAFRERLRKIDPQERIAIGTATDPYQPAERRYRVTRSILEIFATMQGREISIVTKSDLVARDKELLAEVARNNNLFVNLTVTTMDGQLARVLEPMAPRPELRLAAVRELRGIGLACGILCAPLLPGINDRESDLDALAAAGAAAGAQWLTGHGVFLRGSAKEVFFGFLSQYSPGLMSHYQRVFGDAVFLNKEHALRIQARLAYVAEKYRLAPRAAHFPSTLCPVDSQKLPMFEGTSMLIF